MIGRNRPNHRDIALTTLIDLLVQIIFVFTLILIHRDSPILHNDTTPESPSKA